MKNLSVWNEPHEGYVAYIKRLMEYFGIKANVEVEFELHDTLIGNAYGYTDGDRDVINIDIATLCKNEFGELKVISTEDILIALAHEFVHAEQIAEGRLVNHGLFLEGNTLNSRIVFDDKEFINAKYNEQPWEQEAYDLELTVWEACKGSYYDRENT